MTDFPAGTGFVRVEPDGDRVRVVAHTGFGESIGLRLEPRIAHDVSLAIRETARQITEGDQR